MKYIIVTQTYPPRIGGMQNVMTSISKRLSSIEDTHVFPDHFLSKKNGYINSKLYICLLYTSPSPRDRTRSRMPSSA